MTLSFLAIKVILLGIDYSFTNNILNKGISLLIAIGIIYLFSTLNIWTWLKIAVGVILLGGVGYLGFWLFVLSAMASEEVRVIEKSKIQNYEIRLTSRLGFAGPTYYRYDIDKLALFGIIYKDIDQVTVNEIDNCRIDFPRSEISIDKCEKKIITHANIMQ